MPSSGARGDYIFATSSLGREQLLLVKGLFGSQESLQLGSERKGEKLIHGVSFAEVTTGIFMFIKDFRLYALVFFSFHLARIITITAQCNIHSGETHSFRVKTFEREYSSSLI